MTKLNIGGKGAKNLIFTGTLLALMAVTDSALAQNLSKQFSAENIAKFKKHLMVNFKKSDEIKQAAKENDITVKEATNNLNDDVDYLLNNVLSKIVVDHNTVKQYLDKGLNKGKDEETDAPVAVEFMMYGDKGIDYPELAKGLTEQWINFENLDPISDKVKFPLHIIDQYVASLKGANYADQSAIIQKAFDEAMADNKTLHTTGKIKIWFLDKNSKTQFFEQDTAMWNYVESDGENYKSTPGPKELGGRYYYFNINQQVVSEDNTFLDKTEIMKKLFTQKILEKIIFAKYQQLLLMIEKYASDHDTDNKGTKSSKK